MKRKEFLRVSAAAGSLVSLRGGVARAMGLRLMIGCMIESSLGISAVATLTPLFDLADPDGNLLIANDPFRGVRTVGGRLVLGDGPGLGVTGDVWPPVAES